MRGLRVRPRVGDFRSASVPVRRLVIDADEMRRPERNIMSEDDNPTHPRRYDEPASTPQRRGWVRPPVIAAAVVAAVGLTGGTAALAAQSGTPTTVAATHNVPSADGGAAAPSGAPTGASTAEPTPPADGTAPTPPTDGTAPSTPEGGPQAGEYGPGGAPGRPRGPGAEGHTPPTPPADGTAPVAPTPPSDGTAPIPPATGGGATPEATPPAVKGS
jgi:hypothetical protein